MALIDKSIPQSFGDTLGGLMGAVIDAQSQAARATIDFIQEVGTVNGSLDNPDPNNLRNISFNYSKKDENDEIASFNLEIPLLSLVEIPAINLKTAKFSFYYDVVDTPKPQEEAANNTSTADRFLLLKKQPVKVIGRVSKESNTSSNIEKNAGIKVDIEFQQSSLTVGLERVLDMLELAASDTKNKKENNPQ